MTSALIALLLDEVRSEKTEAALIESDTRYISAVTLVELGTVLAGCTSGALSIADVISATKLTVVAQGEIDARLALARRGSVRSDPQIVQRVHDGLSGDQRIHDLRERVDDAHRSP